MPCTEGSGVAVPALDTPPPGPEPVEDVDARRLLAVLRGVSARVPPLRPVELRRVVVERPLATGVTSTVAEAAAEDAGDAAGFAAESCLALDEPVPEALAAPAEEAEERRRGAGVAMGEG